MPTNSYQTKISIVEVTYLALHNTLISLTSLINLIHGPGQVVKQEGPVTSSQICLLAGAHAVLAGRPAPRLHLAFVYAGLLGGPIPSLASTGLRPGPGFGLR